MYIRERLIERLKNYSKEQSLSYRKLSNKINIDYNSLNTLFYKKQITVSPETIEAIVDFLRDNDTIKKPLTTNLPVGINEKRP